MMHRRAPSEASRDRIKVVVRVRPFNKKEPNASSVIAIHEDQIVVGQDPLSDQTPDQVLDRMSPRRSSRQHQIFRYDRCYGPDASQANIFNDIGARVLDNAFQGFNNSVFAYGQTGSGKSYTMVGPPDNPGIIPRVSQELFSRINGLSGESQFTVEASYLEIYNERVRDLLNPRSRDSGLKVREHPTHGPYVEDLSTLAVANYQDISALLDEGNKTRTVAATNMNQQSSRSHAVFTITLTQKSATATRVSRISLVDLAGSERSTAAGTSGLRLQEGSEINKSLLTLGRVISALAADSGPGSGTSIIPPFRDSVLTWLLKDSLGGNSVTTMVVNVAPGPEHVDQTLSTLRFADSAKKIRIHAVVNEDSSDQLVHELRQELVALRQQLQEAQETASRSEVEQDLRDRLSATEKLLYQVNQSWEQRLHSTHLLQSQRERDLEEMGIALDRGRLIGVHSPRRVPHLVNLSEDPLLTECLLYNIGPGITRVGHLLNTSDRIHIRLQGEGILSEHCELHNEDSQVSLRPLSALSSVMVNGVVIDDEVVLHSGDKILLGGSHAFRFQHPQETAGPVSEYGSPLKHQAMVDDGWNINSKPLGWGDAIREAVRPPGPETDDDLSTRTVSKALGARLHSPLLNPSAAFRQYRPLDTSTALLPPPTFARQRIASRPRLSPTASEVQLALKFSHLWRRNVGLVRLAKRVMQLTRVVKQAMAVTRMLDLSHKFNLIVLDTTAAHDLAGPVHDTDQAKDNDMHPLANVHLFIRMANSSTCRVHILSVNQFEAQVRKMHGLLRARDGVQFLGRYMASDAFRIHDDPGLGYVGMIEVAGERLARTSQRLACALVCPYRYSRPATAHLVLTLKPSGRFVLDSVIVSGLDDGIHNLHATGTVDDHTFVFKPLVSDLVLTNTHDQDLVVPARGALRLYIHGDVTRSYLQQLWAWDMEQEIDGDAKTNAQSDTYLTDLAVSTRILELSEAGSYEPQQVVITSSSTHVMLHHGLQRRLAFTLQSPHDCFERKRPVVVELGRIRLVSGHERVVSATDNDLKQAPLIGRTVQSVDPLTHHHSLQFTCQWDSSQHNSALLDHLTKPGNLLLIECRVTVPVHDTHRVLHHASLTLDLPVHISPRSARVSSWSLDVWTQRTVVDLDLQHQFELTATPRRPRCLADFGHYQAFGPGLRAVSVVREYFAHLDLPSPAPGLATTDAVLRQWDYREFVGAMSVPGTDTVIVCQSVDMCANSDSSYAIAFSCTPRPPEHSYLVESLPWTAGQAIIGGSMVMIRVPRGRPVLAWMHTKNWAVQPRGGEYVTRPHLVELRHSTVPICVFISFDSRAAQEKFFTAICCSS